MPTHEPVDTPWGVADQATVHAEGITFYGTPSHGGFRLDAIRNTKVHPALREPSGWYEEDGAWAKVALAFPDLFTKELCEDAIRLPKDYYPDGYEAATGAALAPGERGPLFAAIRECGDQSCAVYSSRLLRLVSILPDLCVRSVQPRVARDVHPGRDVCRLIPVTPGNAGQSTASGALSCFLSGNLCRPLVRLITSRRHVFLLSHLPRWRFRQSVRGGGCIMVIRAGHCRFTSRHGPNVRMVTVGFRPPRHRTPF